MALGRVVLISVEFQVFGRVQGVFFRKETQKICQEHKVVGWVKNTPQGTVVGIAQGDKGSIKTIKHWLSNIGSKRSRIDRCEFKNEREISKKDFTEFSIIR